jgi:hypothetical protein
LQQSGTPLVDPSFVLLRIENNGATNIHRLLGGTREPGDTSDDCQSWRPASRAASYVAYGD